MKHIRPMAKGDPLCPLGFHPQVRWPTRCKRCYRDYKEHGNRNKEQDYKLRRDDVTSSSPALSSWSSKTSDDNLSRAPKSWTSTSNLSSDIEKSVEKPSSYSSNSSLSPWISTPNLASSNSKLSDESSSRRSRNVETCNDPDDDYRRTQYTVRRRTSTFTSKPSIIPEINNSLENNQIKTKVVENDKQPEVSKVEDQRDDVSIADTDDSFVTVVNDDQLQEQVENLKLELERMRIRCERAEQEKTNMLSRRVASLDNSLSTKTSSSEFFKQQHKFNELKSTCESLENEKIKLMSRVKNLETELKEKNTKISETELDKLKSKLQATESLCKELKTENDQIKKEMRDMEDEIDEMQDHFRENEEDEYSSIRKELEITGKNCRILSFKLRKAERKSEQLEADKLESERSSREAIQKLQKDLEEVTEKLRLKNEEGTGRRKAPMLGNIPKTPSGGEKVPRASLIRGGSQEDPSQLQRDLQDSMERESDLREQLRYAEEEAESLRKKVCRMEDDNESLLLQLKKTAVKARSRKSSPSYHTLTPDRTIEKDEGISDEEDVGELKLLLELNEQETLVLRKKSEELEETCETLRKKCASFQEKQSSGNIKNGNKSLEKEVKELKTKLQEKEKECELLTSKSTTNKKQLTFQRSRSLDEDKQSIDIERKLKVIEQQASILRTKNHDLEQENEKLHSENKKLSLMKATKKGSTSAAESELRAKVTALEKMLEASKKVDAEKSNNEITQLKKENANLNEQLKRIKSDSLDNLYKNRIPKRPTDSTSKSALKKMVDELEGEIGEIVTTLEKYEMRYKEEMKKVQIEMDNKQSLLTELEKIESKMDNLSKERDVDKRKFEKEKQDLLKEKLKLETAYKKQELLIEKEKRLFEQEKSKMEESNKKLMEDKSKLDAMMKNMEGKIELLTKQELEQKEKLSSINEELTKSNTQVEKLKIELDKWKTKEKQLNEVSEEKVKKIEELEKRIQDMEMKIRKTDKLLDAKKERLSNMEKQFSKVKEEKESLEKDKLEEIEKNSKLKKSVEDLQGQLKKIKEELTEKSSKIQILEEKSSKSGVKNSSSSQEIEKLQEKLLTSNKKLKEAERNKEQMESEKSILQGKLLSTEENLKKEVTDWKSKFEKLNIEFQKLNELSQNLESENQRKNTMKSDFESKIKKLKEDEKDMKVKFDELKTKTDVNEKELQRLRQQLHLQKEQKQCETTNREKEIKSLKEELKILRGSHTCKQDGWTKERLHLEGKLKDLEDQLVNADIHKLENAKLKMNHDMIKAELEQFKKEMQKHMIQMEHMRKDNEELQKKLDDYEKVVKVHRNIMDEKSTLEIQMKELKTRLYNEEINRKTEVAAMRIRYENHISTISEELKNVQTQLMRYKHERDSYKHMLEDAQKTIDYLKSNDKDSNTTTGRRKSNDEIQEILEYKSKIDTLEQQISCMEDELSESRVEGSRTKTELVSERSAWEVKLSEMTSRINQLEEERLLTSGRTKMPGIKTKVELAWQKEREEQNRLLHETSTLARDLRQTLFEVERERDKEKLEAKRKIDQMKRNTEEEIEDNRKKLNEMQFDLLELRDAHAKLRTTNEKLRREKERLEKEKETVRQSTARLNVNQEDDTKTKHIIDLVSDLLKVTPAEYLKSPASLPPTAAKRKSILSREPSTEKVHSRESSSVREDVKVPPNMQVTLQKLSEVTQQLRMARSSTPSKINVEASRRSFISRKQSSLDIDGGSSPTPIQRRGSLQRKCVSLEHTSNMPQEEAIWRDVDSDGSTNSLQSYNYERSKHDPYDSRLSGDSTYSENLSTTERKKKKGLFGKLKKFARSYKSMDSESEQSTCYTDVHGNSGSNASIASAPEQETKKEFKISRLLKSRTNTPERDKSGESSETHGSFLSRNSNSLPRPPNSSTQSMEGHSSKPLSVPVQRRYK